MFQLGIPPAGVCRMHELVGMFLARLVVDECVYPAYLTDVLAEFAADSAAAATIGKAQSLLCGPHAFSRIEKGWGPGDGRPCEELKVAVATMADEYLASGDASEAQRCVIEMNAPYYHHEVVKRLVVKSFDRGEHERGLVHALLKQLYEAEVRQRGPVRCEAGRFRTDGTDGCAQVITAYQMRSGFGRLAESVEDMVRPKHSYAFHAPVGSRVRQLFSR